MINADTRFNIAYKVLDTTGVKADMGTLDSVINIMKKGTSLDDISFGLFDFCGMNKIIVKVI